MRPLFLGRTDLHHLLPLQGLYLPRPALAVTVPVAQLPVVSVSPAEHLAALRQRHGVAVAAARCHQLGHHETCVEKLYCINTGVILTHSWPGTRLGVSSVMLCFNC